MGADGGSIPTRKELVKKSEVLEPQSPLSSFELCCLSNKRLDYSQLVCDYYGRLYNKEAVIEYLLGKSKSIKQLHSLKDIINLRPELHSGRWRCPLSHRDVCEESSSTTFAASPCGHITQTNLLKSVCPLCSAEVDLPIVLNAAGADLERQDKYFADLKLRRKLARKAKR